MDASASSASACAGAVGARTYSPGLWFVTHAEIAENEVLVASSAWPANLYRGSVYPSAGLQRTLRSAAEAGNAKPYADPSIFSFIPPATAKQQLPLRNGRMTRRPPW